MVSTELRNMRKVDIWTLVIVYEWNEDLVKASSLDGTANKKRVFRVLTLFISFP